MRILIFTKYGPLAASSRYRFLQFIPDLEAEGIECDVSPLLDDDYLREKFETGRTRFRYAWSAFGRRWKAIRGAGEYDAVILYLEDYPYLPGLFARSLMRRSIPYVFDFDDAIFHTYDLHPFAPLRYLLRDKIGRIIRGATIVFAGNRYLEAYASRFSESVEIVPTVVDTHRYGVREDQSKSDTFTIGWIGSPSTAPYLELIAEPLRRFCENRTVRVVLVGSGPVSLEGVDVEYRKWSEESEVDDLHSFDVGVMPLPDSPWARGKCGFKLIQYMACGVPVIASSVGANLDIVEDQVHGFVVDGDDRWVDALDRLYRDPELRNAMGRAGRERVERDFSKTTVLTTISNGIRYAASHSVRDYDRRLIEAFGREWARFDQASLGGDELEDMFDYYFHIFPWDAVPEDAVAMDVGCGSGRWARFVAPRVGTLHCIDPSREALEVARRNLREFESCRFHEVGIRDIPLGDESVDFGYSLGVLHHLEATQRALDLCVSKLKPGAPFLLYLYYAFDNRPRWYRWLWTTTEPARFVLSRLPYSFRYAITQAIAGLIYWPLARLASLGERAGLRVENFPLAAYRNRSFYVMRTDALDRFGTRLEKRFTREEIETMMDKAGLERIRFSDTSYWCAVGFKKAKRSSATPS